jgi:hypothetical protein
MSPQTAPVRPDRTEPMAPLSWAVAVVSVPVGTNGTEALVDVANPHVVLGSWSPSGHPTEVPARLSDAQARHALALGVQRWSTQPLDERVLALDIALAAGAAGHQLVTTATLRRYAETALELGNEIASGNAPAELTQAITDLVHLTIAALPANHDSLEDLRDIESQLSDELSQSALEDYSTKGSAATLGNVSTLAPTRSTPKPELSAERPVDLRLLPARLVAFPGSFSGVSLAVAGEGSDVEVRLPVLPEVDEDTPGVDELLLRAIDRTTGRPVSATPAVVEPSTDGEGPGWLVGHLDLGRRRVDEVEFDFFRAGTQVSSRYGPSRDALIRVDGNAIHGWSLARMSAAGRLFPTENASLGISDTDAKNAITAAIAQTDLVFRTPEAGRRQPHLKELQKSLIERISRPEDAHRPLLSELWHLYTIAASAQQQTRNAPADNGTGGQPGATGPLEIDSEGAPTVISLTDRRARRNSVPIPNFTRGHRAASTSDTSGHWELSPYPGVTLIRDDPINGPLTFAVAFATDLAEPNQIAVLALDTEAGPETLLFVLGSADDGLAALVGSQTMTTSQREFSNLQLHQSPVSCTELSDTERAAIPASFRRSDAQGKNLWRQIGRVLPEGDPIKGLIGEGFRKQ